MTPHFAKFALIAIGLVVVSVFGAADVQAAPIDSMDGTAGYILTSDGTTATISFFGGQIMVVDNLPYIPPATATIGTFNINANTLDVNGFPAPNSKIVDTVGGSQNGIFTFLDAELVFPGAVNTMHIFGSEIATQNTDDPTMDLTKFLDGGIFTFTLNTGSLNLQSLIENGTQGLPNGNLVGTASFSEIAAAVPEPATIVGWTCLGLVMSGFAFRRYRSRKRSI